MKTYFLSALVIFSLIPGAYAQKELSKVNPTTKPLVPLGNPMVAAQVSKLEAARKNPLVSRTHELTFAFNKNKKINVTIKSEPEAELQIVENVIADYSIDGTGKLTSPGQYVDKLGTYQIKVKNISNYPQKKSAYLYIIIYRTTTNPANVFGKKTKTEVVYSDGQGVSDLQKQEEKSYTFDLAQYASKVGDGNNFLSSFSTSSWEPTYSMEVGLLTSLPK